MCQRLPSLFGSDSYLNLLRPLFKDSNIYVGGPANQRRTRRRSITIATGKSNNSTNSCSSTTIYDARYKTSRTTWNSYRSASFRGNASQSDGCSKRSRRYGNTDCSETRTKRFAGSFPNRMQKEQWMQHVGAATKKLESLNTDSLTSEAAKSETANLPLETAVESVKTELCSSNSKSIDLEAIPTQSANSKTKLMSIKKLEDDEPLNSHHTTITHNSLPVFEVLPSPKSLASEAKTFTSNSTRDLSKENKQLNEKSKRKSDQLKSRIRKSLTSRTKLRDSDVVFGNDAKVMAGSGKHGWNNSRINWMLDLEHRQEVRRKQRQQRCKTESLDQDSDNHMDLCCFPFVRNVFVWHF